VMQLGDRVGGPYAWRPIERRPEIVVEQMPAGRNEELVKRAKEARIAARKQKPVQPRLRQRRRCLDERIPGARYFAEQVAPVVQQANIEVTRNLEQRAVDAGELERLRQEIVAFGRDRQIVER